MNRLRNANLVFIKHGVKFCPCMSHRQVIIQITLGSVEEQTNKETAQTLIYKTHFCLDILQIL